MNRDFSGWNILFIVDVLCLDQITVSTTAVSIGTIVFNVSMTDQENDQLFYRMECTPPGGPFVIYNCMYSIAATDKTISAIYLIKPS